MPAAPSGILRALPFNMGRLLCCSDHKTGCLVLYLTLDYLTAAQSSNGNYIWLTSETGDDSKPHRKQKLFEMWHTGEKKTKHCNLLAMISWRCGVSFISSWNAGQVSPSDLAGFPSSQWLSFKDCSLIGCSLDLLSTSPDIYHARYPLSFRHYLVMCQWDT